MKHFDPQSSPGFLVGRVAHRLRVHVRKFIAEAGIQLSAEEHATLTVLAQLDSSKNMGELAELMGRDPTTLKRQLNRLITTGLASRSASPDDGRVIEISITEAGRTMVDATIAKTFALREKALKGISASDRKVLVRALSQMLHNLRDD